MKAFLLLIVLIPQACFACTLPVSEPTRRIALGVETPEFDASWLAFIGVVRAYTKDARGDPAISVEVIDAWTERQRVGEVVNIALASWRGCGDGWESDPGPPLDVTAYAIGTRVRVISRQAWLYQWDLEAGLVALGSPP